MFVIDNFNSGVAEFTCEFSFIRFFMVNNLRLPTMKHPNVSTFLIFAVIKRSNFTASAAPSIGSFHHDPCMIKLSFNTSLMIHSFAVRRSNPEQAPVQQIKKPKKTRSTARTATFLEKQTAGEANAKRVRARPS